MHFLRFFALLAASAVAGLAASDKVPPDAVVAVINGKKWTAAELTAVLDGAPLFVRQGVGRNLKQFVEHYALMDRLAAEAEKQGLDSRSPVKEQLEWNRKQVLLQAAISWKNAQLGPNSLDRQAKLKEWMDGIQRSLKIAYQTEDFFSDPTARDSVGDDVVVVAINGRPVTSAQLKSALAGATPEVRNNFRRDPKAFLQQYAMMLALVEVAEREGLDRRSPYKEQLAWTRSNVLMQAAVATHRNAISLSPDEEQKYYQEHQNDYAGYRVKALYIPFVTGPRPGTASDGREILTEQQARAKIESIRKQAEEGTDFVLLVREHSRDTVSRAKDGDFGILHRSDSLPREFKDAVFSLRAGDISSPVRQANGYYLFRVEEIRIPPLEEIRETLHRDATSAKFNEWFDAVRRSVEIRFENEAYFDAATTQ